MPDRNPIAELQKRLVERGCPAKVVRQIVRETAEHYEDLQRAGQSQGLAGDQVTAFAAEKLGNPDELAERHILSLQNSSWYSRHPQLGFGALPLLLTPFIIVGAPLLSLILLLPIKLVVNYVHNGVEIGHFLISSEVFVAWYGYDAALVLWPIFFCWLAHRRALGFNWVWRACLRISLSILIITLFSIGVFQIWSDNLRGVPPPGIWMLLSAKFHPVLYDLSPIGYLGNSTLGIMIFSVLRSLLFAAIPLVVATLAYARQRYVRAKAR